LNDARRRAARVDARARGRAGGRSGRSTRTVGPDDGRELLERADDLMAFVRPASERGRDARARGGEISSASEAETRAEEESGDARRRTEDALEVVALDALDHASLDDDRVLLPVRLRPRVGPAGGPARHRFGAPRRTLGTRARVETTRRARASSLSSPRSPSRADRATARARARRLCVRVRCVPGARAFLARRARASPSDARISRSRTFKMTARK
jgi:hypothetical protein